QATFELHRCLEPLIAHQPTLRRRRRRRDARQSVRRPPARFFRSVRQAALRFSTRSIGSPPPPYSTSTREARRSQGLLPKAPPSNRTAHWRSKHIAHCRSNRTARSRSKTHVASAIDLPQLRDQPHWSEQTRRHGSYFVSVLHLKPLAVAKIQKPIVRQRRARHSVDRQISDRDSDYVFAAAQQLCDLDRVRRTPQRTRPHVVDIDNRRLAHRTLEHRSHAWPFGLRFLPGVNRASRAKIKPDSQTRVDELPGHFDPFLVARNSGEMSRLLALGPRRETLQRKRFGGAF